MTPVTDDVFAALRGVYAYEHGDLAPVVETVEDASPYWRREKVSFNGGYGERMIAYLFLPRGASPPYQTVVWFPGGDAYFFGAKDGLASQFVFDFIPRSGRAFVYPVYKGTYERRPEVQHERGANSPVEVRDTILLGSKDLSRTLDYLETRKDVDRERFAYYGFSTGATFGPVFTTIDNRFKASILLGGGIQRRKLPPEVTVVNFAPRVRVPTLMINGRDDFIFPLESSQRQLFDLLGLPETQKRHAVLDGGHLPSRVEIIREVLNWLDKYLGPVPPAESIRPSTSGRAETR
jgi:eukaryotic-like serine/threonine-protein kinase